MTELVEKRTPELKINALLSEPMVAETLWAEKSLPLENLEFPVGNPKWEIHATFLSIWILVPSSTEATHYDLAFILGATVVSLGYGFMIWWGYYFGFGLAYVTYHIVALLVFGGLLFQVKLNQTLSLKRFYMSYWILFFLEYFSFFLLYLK